MIVSQKRNILNSTTSLIEAVRETGISRGTGFLFQFEVSENNVIALLVTNKHVVEGAKELRLRISLSGSADFETKVGVGAYEITDGLDSLVIAHPHLDLAAVIMAPLLKDLEQRGLSGHGLMFNKHNIATDEELSSLGPAEDIVMPGYPIGLSDVTHNLPIVRQGIVASDPMLPFNGEPQFLIDCACYPGSSGSPVLLKERQTFIERDGSLAFDQRASRLIGVLFAGPVLKAAGEFVPRPIPTAINEIVQTNLMINLGYVIPAKHILDFEMLAQSHPLGGNFNFNFDVTMFEGNQLRHIQPTPYQPEP